MATASYREEDEDILHCCMCRNILEDSKILDCLHRCCRKCLIGVIGAVAPGDGSFQCPSCQHEQKVPDDGVDGISDDSFLKEIVHIKKLERDIKNNNEERTCSSCEKQSTVVAICSHCCGFLCEGCYSSHSLMKTFKSHVHIATLKDIETGKTTFDVRSVSYSPNPKCPKHDDMPLNINCQTCEEQICSLCVPSSHQTHQLEDIDAAGKRTKTRITEMVEESKQKETVLEDRNEEITELRKKYESTVCGILEKAEAEAKRAEKSIKDQKEKDLQDIEDQRRRTEKSAQEKLEQVHREKKFIEDEATLLKSFVLHFLGDVETETQEAIRKVKDRQKMAKILTTDGNNWSLLRAIKEIEKTLTCGGDEKDSFIKACSNAVLKLSTLSSSATSEICWKKQTDKLIDRLLKPEDCSIIARASDVGCNNKDNILSVATINNQISSSGVKGKVSVIMINCDNLKRDSTYTPELSGAKRVIVAGNEDGRVYTVIGKSKASSLYCNAEYRGDFNLPNKVLCCSELPSGEGFLVSVEDSTTLYKCNYEAMQISSISIEEADLQPPVALSVGSDGTIILGDGKSKALSVTDQGAVKHRFQRRHFTDRPLRVAIDRQGFIYVLWSRGKDYSCVMLQYSPKGRVISEIHVPYQMDLMTAMAIRDCDTIVLGRPWTQFEFYEKTPFGEMLGQHVLHKEDPSRYQPLSVWLVERREGGGEDVAIVGEKKATPEQIARAEKLMLPPHFFLYEKKPPCPGCVGCDEEDLQARAQAAKAGTSPWTGLGLGEKPKASDERKVPFKKGSVEAKDASLSGLSTSKDRLDEQAKDTLSLADQFRPPAGSWNCDTCFVNNPPDKMECLACTTSKPGATKPSITDFKFGSSQLSLADQFRPPAGSWNCDTCFVNNPPDRMECLACTTPKPGATKPSTTDFKFGSSQLSLADQFRPPAGSWNCDTCFVNNPPDKMECLACTTPKPGATKPSTTDFKFGSSQLSLADQFRPPAGSWNCDTCFVNNPPDKMECLACTTPKPGATKPSTTDFKFGSSQNSFAGQQVPGTVISPAQEDQEDMPTGLFSSLAPESFAFNTTSGFPSTLSASSMHGKIMNAVTRGGLPEPFKSSSNCGFEMFKLPVENSFGAPKSEKPAEPEVSETTKASNNVFGFTTSVVINNNSNSDTTKDVPDSTVEDPALGKAAGSTATERPASQKFTFGGGMTQFSFGSHGQGKSAPVVSVGSHGTASESKPIDLACGGSPSSNKAPTAFQGFSFNQKPVENAAPFAGNGQFSFLHDIDTVTASTPKSIEGKPQVKSPRNERDDLRFEPILKLPGTVVLETGEENAEVKFTHRAKLYRFDVAGSKWEERGVGDIKVLYDPKTGKHRIVMRREQVLIVCANHFITDLVDLKPNARSAWTWVWHAMDASDGEVRNEQLAVRFKTEKAAKEFKEAVDEAKKTT